MATVKIVFDKYKRIGCLKPKGMNELVSGSKNEK